MKHVNALIETPRERQMKFRAAVKETAGWLLLAAIPYLMIIHWLIVGY